MPRDPLKFQTRILGSAAQRVEDLHDLTIEYDWSSKGTLSSLRDRGGSSVCGCTRAYFRDLEKTLIGHILEADFVMGCVAWLTSEPILDALSKPKWGCQIIVQKEDFLRPDIDARGSWAHRLRKLYDQLDCAYDRSSLPSPINELSVACDWSIDPVRCVGNHNASRQAAFPRAHHKFVVFCRAEEVEDGYQRTYPAPYAVWTGSFNFTKNAGRSFENALYITDPLIVDAYAHEYAQIAALSEALDWTSTWAAPEWRIGT